MQNSTMYEVPKKKDCVNFSHSVFSLVSKHEDLAMQALVWLHMVRFRVIWCDEVQFDASYANLR